MRWHCDFCSSPSVRFLLLPILLLLPVTEAAFEPVFIGPPFRAESRMSASDDRFLRSICGRPRDTGGGGEGHAAAATGNETVVEPSPWAVSLLYRGRNVLGGTLISPYHVLSVAHPFLQFPGLSAVPCRSATYRNESFFHGRRVGYGGRCIRGRTRRFENDDRCPARTVQLVRIRSVMVDGAFERLDCEHGHDWAIIELEEAVVLDERTWPICMTPANVPALNWVAKKGLTVVGWGRQSIFQEGSPYMRSARMVLDKDCTKRPNSDELPGAQGTDIFCAHSINTSDFFAPRTCHGDSGAGAQVFHEPTNRTFLVGLTSFGTKGCPANELARFTKLEPYLEPICKYTGVCYPQNTDSVHDFDAPLS